MNTQNTQIPNEFFLPDFIRHDRTLTPSAKFIYGDIVTTADEHGVCRVSAKTFAEWSRLNTAVVKRAIKELENRNLITVRPIENIVELLKNKNVEYRGFGNQKCEWCGCMTAVLHNHHYPITKADGGTETVAICPNCHHEFHYHESPIHLTMTTEELHELNKLKEARRNDR